ncbi:hypothetical protein KRX11_02095 [Pasteurellaceae bacterium TAE3-ERU1]|uniref:hypothetical protein n=1 Tax=Spirabiliibacterium mucosae TaxID=28156 RepID=UPI001AAD318D|nr:hypothetical protein [Spirabiliibacterium mucosae]MBE2897751.1 hypothetical protein [Spirabiliibacterium mucosae]MBV7387437.1 hypothetical protein [Pasteurellaceae bacterium TAE3-ERU1]
MLTLFKRPIEKETLDAWAKMSDDIAKVAILAVPVVILGENAILNKGLNAVMLLMAIFLFMNIARKLRVLKATLGG